MTVPGALHVMSGPLHVMPGPLHVMSDPLHVMSHPLHVMLGLDPSIYRRTKACEHSNIARGARDGRVNPGHDGLSVRWPQ